jgi:hypothetical protein
MARQGASKFLHKAKKSKNDEFYTQYIDIQKEVEAYLEYNPDIFRNKVIYCNCDDPRVSNFFHYFSYNFKFLELKKLITTCYKNQNLELFSQNNSEKAIYLEYNGEKNGGNIPSLEEIGIKYLNGNGDFRSDECIEILKECDIVITNPPFSLFREYIAQLMEYDKNFLIIGNYNAITYKEVFGYIKENKLWLGYNYVKEFRTPDGSIKKFGNICWFTNLGNKNRHIDLIRDVLYKKYNEVDYPKYDNYDAINIDKVADIPVDYFGYMGVPITFMDKYNPEQFELYGIMNTGEINEGIRYENTPHGRPITNGVEKYLRIIIKKK